MHVVIKGAKTIEEYKKTQQEIISRAEVAYYTHKNVTPNWSEGEAVKAWINDDGEICLQYESGSCWAYKDLDMPFPTWKKI